MEVHHYLSAQRHVSKATTPHGMQLLLQRNFKPAKNSRSRRVCVVPTATSSVPTAPKYKPIPVVRGTLPWIGILHRTSVDQMFQHIAYEFAETEARCLQFQLFGNTGYYARHPDDIGSALKHSNKWVKSPRSFSRLHRWLGHGLVSELDQQQHAAAREVLGPAFKAQSVKELLPLFTNTAKQLADILVGQSGRAIELEPLTRRATLDVIGTAGFGYDFQALQLAAQQLQQEGAALSNISSATGAVKGHKDKDVVAMFDDLLNTSMLLILDPPVPDYLVPGYQGYMKAVEMMDKVAQHVLKERREQGISPTDRSLLSFMLRAQQSDPTGIVTDEHIRDQLMTFMLAGSDTSAVTLAFCLQEMASRPEVMHKVQLELDSVLGDTPTDQLQPEVFQSLPFLRGCINESLRLYPAAPGLLRIATEDAVFGEHFIPKGSAVVMDLYSMHRHADFWPQPTQWLPERWLPATIKALGPRHPDAFMPFSAGARSCIGRYFAVLEMQVVLAVLLRRLSFEAVDKGEIAVTQSFTLKSKDAAKIVPVAR